MSASDSQRKRCATKKTPIDESATMPDDFCALHQSIDSGLGTINVKCDAILTRIGQGDTRFAVIEMRLLAAEEKIGWLLKLVAGIVALLGTAIFGAILALVLKT